MSGARADIPEEKRLEPFMKLAGDKDYICGNCGHTLLEAINEGQIRNMVYKCPNCGKYNELL